MDYFIYCLVTVFFTLFSTGSSTICPRHHFRGNDTFHECKAGCCYRWIYPCCKDPSSFTRSDPFFASAVFRIVGFCLLILGVLVVVLIVRRQQLLKRLRERQRTSRALNNLRAAVVSDGNMSIHQGTPMTAVISNNNNNNNSSNNNNLPQNNFLPPSYDSLPPAYSTLPPPYKASNCVEKEDETK